MSSDKAQAPLLSFPALVSLYLEGYWEFGEVPPPFSIPFMLFKKLVQSLSTVWKKLQCLSKETKNVVMCRPSLIFLLHPVFANPACQKTSTTCENNSGAYQIPNQSPDGTAS